MCLRDGSSPRGPRKLLPRRCACPHTVYFNFNKTNASYGDYNNMLGKAAAYGATVMGMAAAWIRKAIRAERDCVKTF